MTRILWNLYTYAKDEAIPTDFIIVDVSNIPDDKANLEQLRVLFETIIKGYMMRDKTLRIAIRCEAGLSRSNAIAVGILAFVHHISFDDAVRIVQHLNPRAMMSTSLLESIREAVINYDYLDVPYEENDVSTTLDK